MKQMRQLVHAIKQSIYLDVYGATTPDAACCYDQWNCIILGAVMSNVVMLNVAAPSYNPIKSIFLSTFVQISSLFCLPIVGPAAIFCRQMASWVPAMFCNFY
jgi:hypothetical protein